MAQTFTNLLDILLNMSDWATDWNANIGLIKATLRTNKMSISVQGSHTSPSRVDIQLQDAAGNSINETVYLRVRIVNNNGYANATNGTIAVFTGTVVETLTANKDLIIKSNSSGLIQITCTDATIETFQVLIGSASLSGSFDNWHNSQTVVHA